MFAPRQRRKLGLGAEKVGRGIKGKVRLIRDRRREAAEVIIIIKKVGETFLFDIYLARFGVFF